MPSDVRVPSAENRAQGLTVGRGPTAFLPPPFPPPPVPKELPLCHSKKGGLGPQGKLPTPAGVQSAVGGHLGPGGGGISQHLCPVLHCARQHPLPARHRSCHAEGHQGVWRVTVREAGLLGLGTSGRTAQRRATKGCAPQERRMTPAAGSGLKARTLPLDPKDLHSGRTDC